MEIKNSYWYFESALSKEFCDKIINLGNEKIKQAKDEGQSTTAFTFGDKQKNEDKTISLGELSVSEFKEKDKLDKVYVRDSEVTWLKDQWIYNEIVPMVETANINAGWRYEFDAFEAFQFTVYHSPGGFYGWHNDMPSDHYAALKRYIHGITDVPLRKNGEIPFGYTKDNDLVGKIRKLSVTINLTDPNTYEGGNLKFDLGNHNTDKFHEAEIARKQGSVVVFPSYLEHCVTPVTKGTRYSLVLWCSGRPFK